MIAATKKILVGLFAISVSLSAFSQAPSNLLRIALAGGQIENETYTNSLEALNANFEEGFRVFEIDFSWTTDTQLVCLHDWEQSFERSFGVAPRGAVSLQEFQQLVAQRSKFTKCDLASLMHWLSEHSDALLVTDVKKGNLDALRHISANYPQFLSRIVPQIYQPTEYSVVRDLGFERIIWTLYMYSGGSLAVLDAVKAMDLWAVTMDTTRAERNLGQNLNAIDVPSYVHTINALADSLYFKSLGIDEIYTDSLSLQRERTAIAKGGVSIADSKFYQTTLLKSEELAQKLNSFFNKPVLHYSLENDFSQLSVSTNQLSFQVSPPGRLLFAATGNDPYIGFPVFSDPRTQIELYARLTVPDSSSVEVFYATQSQPNFAASRRELVQVTEGQNEIVISINAEEPITQIRLDPGTVPGDYSIGRLEVRSD